MLEDFNDWIQSLVNEFNNDYGTTTFFSSPIHAKNWVEEKVIKPNPRIGPTEKNILLENSNEAFTRAVMESDEPKVQALLYWRSMQDYIALNSYDEKLHNIFEVGAETAQQTTEGWIGEIEPFITPKIPWGLIVLPIGWLLFRKE